MSVARARELFTAGDLGGAIAALTEAVKKAPGQDSAYDAFSQI